MDLYPGRLQVLYEICVSVSVELYLEHLFLVGWVTRIAVKPRKISIYRTFTVSGIFYQMTIRKPGNCDGIRILSNSHNHAADRQQ